MNSPKQKANRERFKANGPKINGQEKATLGLPAKSWWLGLNREELEEEVAKEAPRMRNSLLGRITSVKPID